MCEIDRERERERERERAGERKRTGRINSDSSTIAVTKSVQGNP